MELWSFFSSHKYFQSYNSFSQKLTTFIVLANNIRGTRDLQKLSNWHQPYSPIGPFWRSALGFLWTSLSILSQTRALPTHSVNYSIISISSMAPIIMQLFFCTFIVGMPQTINSKGAGTVSGLLSYEVEWTNIYWIIEWIYAFICMNECYSVFIETLCNVLCLVMSNSLQPRGLYPTRLLCPWRFSRKEYWHGLPCPSPGYLPNPESEPRSSTLQANSSPSEPPGKPKYEFAYKFYNLVLFISLKSTKVSWNQENSLLYLIIKDMHSSLLLQKQQNCN